MLARIKIPGSFERILYIQGGWEVSCLFSAFYVLCSKVACSCPDSWGGGRRRGDLLLLAGPFWCLPCIYWVFVGSFHWITSILCEKQLLNCSVAFFFFFFPFFWSGALKQQRKRVRIAASLKTGLRSENLSTDKACAGKGVSNSTAWKTGKSCRLAVVCLKQDGQQQSGSSDWAPNPAATPWSWGCE